MEKHSLRMRIQQDGAWLPLLRAGVWEKHSWGKAPWCLVRPDPVWYLHLWQEAALPRPPAPQIHNKRRKAQITPFWLMQSCFPNPSSCA